MCNLYMISLPRHTAMLSMNGVSTEQPINGVIEAKPPVLGKISSEFQVPNYLTSTLNNPIHGFNSKWKTSNTHLRPVPAICTNLQGVIVVGSLYCQFTFIRAEPKLG
jgi:hypothetical protein